ncbi:MAG: DUF3298 and DUF4163 domain-containing protein [Pseudomonadota bacterium]|nr:DUF3298 and DUF4163 domain-containing protein [Pseudomonadota bacterium]
MTCNRTTPLVLLPLLALLLTACNRDRDPASTQTPSNAPPVAAAPAQPVATAALKDVLETNERYIIGIGYPPDVAKYPALAAELKQYADAARAELMQAVSGLGNDKPLSPYDLSLRFYPLLETPQLVAIAADGSTYTGGAHGTPLIARFVWLPQENTMLDAGKLVPQATGWKAISEYVREQLHGALSQRIDADELPPGERAELTKSAGKMIDGGSEASAQNFAQFEPIAGAGGKLKGLRFVFPPYQVGPYADGTQTVDVPAEILLPHVAPEYRTLFVGG